MRAFIYLADIYCEDCGDRIRGELIRQGKAPPNIEDETSYDSDEFPKGPYNYGGGEADSPQHCASHGECLNALVLNGHRCGCWLENDLTEVGVEYVKEAMKEGGKVAEYWVEVYSSWYDLGIETEGDEEE